MMKTAGRRLTKLLLPLLILSVFSTSACSVLKKTYSWIPFLHFADKSEQKCGDDIAAFSATVKPASADAETLYKQARYFQKINKHKLAIGNFHQILQANPEHVEACNAMGVSYDALGDLPRALEAYKKALHLSPTLDYIHNNLGYTYLRMGSLDKAVASFKKAIELNDQKPVYHNNLGLAYAKKGLTDQAFWEFKTAGGEAKAHFNIAQVLFREGSYTEAKAHFAMAARSAPALPGVKTNLQAAEALRVASRDLEQHPSVAAPNTRRSDRATIALISASATPKTSKKVLVEVANGNGVAGMARSVQIHLLNNGLSNTCAVDAENHRYTQTRIYYCEGYLHDAYDIAKLIPGYQNMEKVPRLGDPAVKIRVLIGKDLSPADFVNT